MRLSMKNTKFGKHTLCGNIKTTKTIQFLKAMNETVVIEIHYSVRE